jgi:dienelactone hydrolase
VRDSEQEEFRELREYPPQAGEAPSPVLLAQGSRVAVAYVAEDGRRAIAFFPRYEACRLACCSEPAFVEIRRSSWLAEVERARSPGDAELRHLVFAFPGLRIELVTPRWDLHMSSASGSGLMDELRALLDPEPPPQVLPLVDEARGRELPTALYLPKEAPAPLVVFAHGWFGHPRKFTRLFQAWSDAGIAVAAPAFPRTNDESPLQLDSGDVVEQPRDVSFVVDELLRDESLRGRLDAKRVALAGYSLGAATALAAARGDDRVRAVAFVAGRLNPEIEPVPASRDVPLLVVHGRADTSVPYDEGCRVYKAAGAPKAFLTLHDAGHDVCQDTASVLDNVVAATTAFWRLYLLGDESARARLLAAAAGNLAAEDVAPVVGPH